MDFIDIVCVFPYICVCVWYMCVVYLMCVMSTRRYLCVVCVLLHRLSRVSDCPETHSWRGTGHWALLGGMRCNWPC